VYFSGVLYIFIAHKLNRSTWYYTILTLYNYCRFTSTPRMLIRSWCRFSTNKKV